LKTGHFSYPAIPLTLISYCVLRVGVPTMAHMKSALFVIGFVSLVFAGAAATSGPAPRDDRCKLTERQIREFWAAAGRFKDESERTRMTVIAVEAAENLCRDLQKAPTPLPPELQQLLR